MSTAVRVIHTVAVPPRWRRWLREDNCWARCWRIQHWHAKQILQRRCERRKGSEVAARKHVVTTWSRRNARQLGCIHVRPHAHCHDSHVGRIHIPKPSGCVTGSKADICVPIGQNYEKIRYVGSHPRRLCEDIPGHGFKASPRPRPSPCRSIQACHPSHGSLNDAFVLVRIERRHHLYSRRKRYHCNANRRIPHVQGIYLLVYPSHSGVPLTAVD
mmetsp:Transcript_29935/g.78504  ORF Transcript_29935/g.78504 Transcript_29935/m.78504 type:complete len:215 (-) Transcript_29935:136-780(-)